MNIFSKQAAKPFFDDLIKKQAVPEQWLQLFRDEHSAFNPKDLTDYPNVKMVEKNCLGRNGNIPLIVFEPKNPIGKTFIYIHGGGFISPLGGRHLIWAKYIAAHANIRVVCIEHRLAPEHPFPAALHDCVDVYEFYRVTSSHEIIVGGDSSGGNLSLAVSLYCVNEKITLPDKILAMCPVTDLNFEKHLSMLNQGVDNPNIAHMFLAMGAFQRACYVPNKKDWSNCLVSAIYGNLAKIPLTLVVAAEKDYCYDDNLAFVEKMRKDGGDVILHSYQGMPHSFFTYFKLLPKQAGVANQRIIEFMV